ncbi:hypothetical protein NE865_12324 [Phthorimaea operculella]|nr:hypothetical protein NE865_12324 [Phthorimaea operculella]
MILQEMRQEIQNIIREELQISLKFYSDKIDEYTEKMTIYDANFKTLENQCKDLRDNLKNTNLKCSVLESKINQLEQNQMMNQLDVCGIKEKDNEDPETIAKKIATAMEVKPEDILKAYRKRARTSASANSKKTDSAVITVHLRDGKRDQWLNNAKKIKLTMATIEPSGSDSDAIYLRETLAPGIAFLLWKTKEALKDSYKYIWCKNGTVLLRKQEGAKIISIKALSELETVCKALQKKPN